MEDAQLSVKLQSVAYCVCIYNKITFLIPPNFWHIPVIIYLCIKNETNEIIIDIKNS